MVNAVSTSEAIMEQQTALAQLITSMHFAEKPELEARYSKTGREKALQNALYHLTYLAASIRTEKAAIFNYYLKWIRIVMETRNVPTEVLIDNLKYVDKACAQLLPVENYNLIRKYLENGIEIIKENISIRESYLEEDNPLLSEAREYLSLLINGKKREAQRLIEDLIRKNHSIPTIYDKVFKVTQYEVGLLWQTNKITVGQEHYCTAATQMIMSSVFASVLESKRKGVKLVACSISGDLHELGIRMIADLFELNGWDTYYIGSNMPDDKVITTLKEQNPDVLAISVTIPYHLSRAEELIKKIRNDHSLVKLKIIVGGYSFNIVPDLWKQFGADGFAINAHEAVLIANNLIGKA